MSLVAPAWIARVRDAQGLERVEEGSVTLVR